MSTIIVAAIVFAWLGYVIYKSIKDKKEGKGCSCGNSCGGCGAGKDGHSCH